MFPFERPIRDLVLRRFSEDAELHTFNDKELFTTALNRYADLRARERDMYRETMDDLVDGANGKKPFSVFPPKYRHEGKYYTDCWRERRRDSRLRLYRLRKWVLWELASYKLMFLRRWPWQTPYITDFENLKRLQALIAEFEDRCFMEIRQIASRIEYDEIRHKIIEYTPKGDPKELRDFKPGKEPEKFIQCLFDHEGMELTHEQIYQMMGVSKPDRRLPRWRKEQRLSDPDISGKYIHWIEPDRVLFNSRHLSSEGREEGVKYPLEIPKPSKVAGIIGGIWFRCCLLLRFGSIIRIPVDDLTERRRRPIFAGQLWACIIRRLHRPSTHSKRSVSDITA